MTIGLIRIRAELPLSDGESLKRNPSYRQFDVPPNMAEQIIEWYKASGWSVETEQL